MALNAPEEGFVWLTVPLHESIDVVVIGDVESWYTHWYRGPGSKNTIAVRCVKEEVGECVWCTGEFQQRVRYVFPVRFDDQVRLIELGRVQYPALVAIYTFERWIGSRLRLVRERPVKNAPIQLRRVGEEVVPAEAVVDCSELVKGLGRANLRMLYSNGALDAVQTERDGRPMKQPR